MQPRVLATVHVCTCLLLLCTRWLRRRRGGVSCGIQHIAQPGIPVVVAAAAGRGPRFCGFSGAAATARLGAVRMVSAVPRGVFEPHGAPQAGVRRKCSSSRAGVVKLGVSRAKPTPRAVLRVTLMVEKSMPPAIQKPARWRPKFGPAAKSEGAKLQVRARSARQAAPTHS